ncbi:MAG: phosphate acyltransferase [Austwickia sp.]|nr:AAA family ATPase [Actinomycetota bacterium]MCB1253558.1 AAA family ATPase [Austwickia sp.]MCO5308785.1 phosphate acyltransferase [Austwickia sp.]
MARRILVVPVNHGAGVTVACLGLVHALGSRHVAVAFCKPFAQDRGFAQDQSTELIRMATSLRPPQPISVEELDRRLAGGRLMGAMSRIVERTAEIDAENRILVLEGLAATPEQPYADRLNIETAQSLDAEVLLVGAVGSLEPERFADLVATAEQMYRSRGQSRVLGVVANRVPEGADSQAYVDAVARHHLRCVGVVGDHPDFVQPRVSDVVRNLGIQVLSGHDLGRRVARTVIAAQAVPGFIPSLAEGALIVAPGDRHDVLLSVALAEAGGTRLAGLLLTAGIAPHPDVLRLVEPALASGLPLLLTDEKTFPTAQQIVGIDQDIPADDEARARRVMEVVADGYDEGFLAELPTVETSARITPAKFEYHLRAEMSKGRVRLALTDGDDTRVLHAVSHLHRFGALQFTLLGDPAAIEAQLARLHLQLPLGSQIVNPAKDTPETAAIREALAAAGTFFEPGDPLIRALALLHTNHVDGLVGGIGEDRDRFLAAVRSAVPLGSDVRTLSSSSATMLPDEVVFFADALINAHPNAEQLACIAAQTAATARLAGLVPHVAFVAPSSWSPTAHHDRQTIAAARQMLAERRPDLRTEGPEAFQAAARRHRTPEGDATVFVFPDIASAAATAKAIGQSGGAQVHPPVLQGLAKPVNMLPMDATVEGVMDLIVATAVKAAELG